MNLVLMTQQLHSILYHRGHFLAKLSSWCKIWQQSLEVRSNLQNDISMDTYYVDSRWQRLIQWLQRCWSEGDSRFWRIWDPGSVFQKLKLKLSSAICHSATPLSLCEVVRRLIKWGIFWFQFFIGILSFLLSVTSIHRRPLSPVSL